MKQSADGAFFVVGKTVFIRDENKAGWAKLLGFIVGLTAFFLAEYKNFP
jgi:hypothetical protein